MQVTSLGAPSALLALAAEGPAEAARAAEEGQLQRELAVQDARLQVRPTIDLLKAYVLALN